MTKVYVVEGDLELYEGDGEMAVYSTLEKAKASLPNVTWREDKYGWFVGGGTGAITEFVLDGGKPEPTLFEVMQDASQEGAE